MFLSIILQIIFNDIYRNLMTIFICYSTFKLAQFYIKVWNLPPGPFPLPIVGNILEFRSKLHFDEVIRKLDERYGPLFTVWLANKPYVFITDIDIAREAFNKCDLSGRPSSYFGSVLSNEMYQDIIFTDQGKTWEALRKMAHSAVRKYSTNDKLEILSSDCVDSAIQAMINKEGIGKEFVPDDYIYLLFLNIMASSVFGIKYSADDQEFKKYKYIFKGFVEEVGPRLLLWEFSPLFRLLDANLVQKQRKLFNEMIDSMRNRFISHYEDYDPTIERDFCDALIFARNEALRDGKESFDYLNDENLARTVFDILFAGTDSSMHTFQWILLLIAYYPRIQNRIREEIESEVGDRVPKHEDKQRCHYTMAFITEILRFRNIVKSGFPHKAVVNSKIGKYEIPKGMGVFVYHGIILIDEKHWTNGQEFRPERFLENEKYITTRHKAYIPFGVGRRICLGEKLAIAHMFLVLVRFFQKTCHYNITLGTNGGIEGDPNVVGFYTPRNFKIKLIRK